MSDEDIAQKNTHEQSGIPRVDRLAILKILYNPEEWYSSTSTVSEEELEHAASDDHLFEELLLRGGHDNPRNAFATAQLASAFWKKHHAEFEHQCALAIQNSPAHIMYYAEPIASVVGPEKLHEYIRAVIAQQPELLITYSSKQLITSAFSKEELRDTVLATIQNECSRDLQDLRSLVPHILSVNEACEITIRSLENKEVEVTSLRDVPTLFTDTDQRAALVETVRSAYLRHENPLTISIIRDVEELFSREESATLLRQRMADQSTALSQVTFDLLKDLLSSNDLHDITLRAIREQQDTFVSEGLEDILAHVSLTIDEERTLWTLLQVSKPTFVLPHINRYINTLPPEERASALQDLMNRIDPTIALRNLHHWINAVEPDPSAQKEYVRATIGRQFTVTFLVDYLDANNSTGEWLRTHFTRDEIAEIVTEQAELNPETIINNINEVREFLRSDDTLRVMLNRVFESDPVTTIQKFQRIAFLYQPDEVERIIDGIMSTERGAIAVIESFCMWHLKVGGDYAYKRIMEAVEQTPHLVLRNIDLMAPYVPEGDRATFVERVVWANPAQAYVDNTAHLYVPQLTREGIVSRLVADQNLRWFAPRTIREQFERASRTNNTEENIPHLLRISTLYEMTYTLHTTGWDAILRDMLQKGAISQADEVRAVQVCVAFAQIDVSPDDTPFSTYSLTELERALTVHVASRMGIAEAVTQESMERFITAMGSFAPFITYYLQYEHDERRADLLKGIFRSVLTGTFPCYKYGTPLAEGLLWAKEHRYIPEVVSIEQYELWQHDDTTELHSLFEVDATKTACEMRIFLEDNLAHCALSQADISADVTDIQQQVATTGTRIAELQKQRTYTISENARIQLTEEEQELLSTMQKYQRVLTIKQLMGLSPTDISTGFLVRGDSDPTKGAPLSALIKKLEKIVPEEGRFIPKQLRVLIADFKENVGNSQKKLLTITDSSSPKHLMEIGEKPVPSCQHYATGSHNDCLLGYVAPGRKFLIVTDETGAIQARSVFRLLSSTDGGAALHMERIYRSSASDALDRALYAHAQKKAAILNVPLYVSSTTYSAWSKSEEHFTTTPAGISLHSYNSPAPTEYVDSANGRAENGVFTLNGLLEISPADK